jgi:preprotein translocase subunit SecD
MLVSVILTCLVCFGALGAVVAANWSPHLGLDLEGGLEVVFQPTQKATSAELQTVVGIMQARANGLGLAQPNIGTQGSNIVVALPGVKNAQAVLQEIGSTAQLFFRPVLCAADAYAKPKGAKPPTHYVKPPACGTQYIYTTATYNTAAQSNLGSAPDPALTTVPSTPQGQDKANRVVLISNLGGNPGRYELGPAPVAPNGQPASGEILSSANAQLTTTSGWVVNFTIKSQYSAFFDTIAAKEYHLPLAIDLGGVVQSAPTINTTSFGGSGEITGDFSQTQANKLALVLKYGQIPISFKPATYTTVSPTLGKKSLQAGLLAGLLGLLLVMGYTIFYYRALGVVVVLGLVTTGAFLYGVISILGATSAGLTLDLSGMTGLIVSVGITVDSYIVFFERLKDEVRAGRSVRSSVDRGFRSAYRTILSADAVSFLGALVLWLLSIGAVRGFAFMLGLSTLVDVATAYLFTRPLVIMLGRNPFFTEARGFGIARGLAVTGEAG